VHGVKSVKESGVGYPRPPRRLLISQNARAYPQAEYLQLRVKQLQSQLVATELAPRARFPKLASTASSGGEGVDSAGARIYTVLSLSLPLSLSHTHLLSLSLCLSVFPSLSLSLSHTHAHTHTHSLAHSLARSLSHARSRTLTIRTCKGRTGYGPIRRG
jgi:hypothetical protein